AYRFSTSSVPDSRNVSRWTVKPARPSTSARYASAPPSAGVTDGQRMRARAIATGSAAPLIAGSIPQQLVDAGLGARLLVDALDDDRAVEAGAGRAIRQRLARHGAGHDHRIGRHLANKHLAGLAVDDLGRCADEHAHGEHRAGAHDHALDDL